ncbi:Dirigent protein 25 [Capsicum annuum]|uniref:Dirigent protein n=1 Tax=Capsicum annuum TaxID=4072 RepID=A0A2G2YGN3_CAPAN|nr:Dirigent protein 25 [Capsicum annuum]
MSWTANSDPVTTSTTDGPQSYDQMHNSTRNDVELLMRIAKNFKCLAFQIAKPKYTKYQISKVAYGFWSLDSNDDQILCHQDLSDAPTFTRSSRAFEICSSVKPSSQMPLSTSRSVLYQKVHEYGEMGINISEDNLANISSLLAAKPISSSPGPAKKLDLSTTPAQVSTPGDEGHIDEEVSKHLEPQISDLEDVSNGRVLETPPISDISKTLRQKGTLAKLMEQAPGQTYSQEFLALISANLRGSHGVLKIRGGTGVAAAATPIGAGVAVPSAHSDVATPTTHADVAAHAGADHVATAVASGVGEDDHIFSYDILGGSNPSAIAVTMDNGVPVNNGNSGIISNNNIPFLTGLSGTTPNVIQNNGNNNIIGGGSGYPALNLAQLGSGVTFQKLLFGTMTVFDDELTEGHELNSGLVGKAQGFYIASSEDGTSQTMAFTVMLHSGSYSDSLSLFGVHRVKSL